MNCAEFFSELPQGPDVNKRAGLVQKHDPDGDCEDHQVSQHSAGPVKNDEFLLRCVYSPLHLDDEGNVNAAFFSDAKDKGLSCDRCSEDDSAASRERGQKSVEAYNAKLTPGQTPRQLVGLARVKVEAARQASAQEAGRRVFFVYDTALADNKAHVDVFQFALGTKSEQQRHRKSLRDAFLEYGLARELAGPGAGAGA